MCNYRSGTRTLGALEFTCIFVYWANNSVLCAPDLSFVVSFCGINLLFSAITPLPHVVYKKTRRCWPPVLPPAQRPHNGCFLFWSSISYLFCI